MLARTICALALFLIPLSGAHAALRDIDFGRYHALVIGINEYKNLSIARNRGGRRDRGRGIVAR